MRRTVYIFSLILVFITSTALASVVATCQEKEGGLKKFSRRYNPGLSNHLEQMQNILKDCLTTSNLSLEIEAGSPYLPHDTKPIFKNADGTTFVPNYYMDKAICYKPEALMVIDGDYIDPSRSIPRQNLDTWYLWYSGKERARDLNTALSGCLALSNLEIALP
jgi:hypothetical protein